MKKKTFFGESLLLNQYTYAQYKFKIIDLALSRFIWKNLPVTCDERYMELSLLKTGSCCFFLDDDFGYLSLSVIRQSGNGVYGYPAIARAYSIYNSYTREITPANSVIIYNNMLRTTDNLNIDMYARRLYNLDRIIDVNSNAQKTPVLIKTSEQQRLTILNLYKDYDGNAPVIYGDDELTDKPLESINTGAPYVCDKIMLLKSQIWTEILTYLGIPSTPLKRERMITDEMHGNLSMAKACMQSALNARKQGCKKIHELFGINIDVEFNSNIYGGDNDG